MESIDQLSVNDKMTMIRNRYKSTKDLWIYMVERCKYCFDFINIMLTIVGYLMPTLKNCRL